MITGFEAINLLSDGVIATQIGMIEWSNHNWFASVIWLLF
jgi:hypothetical protein